MIKKPLILLIVAVVLLAAAPAWADWDEGQPHKMHWPQLPDPYGWDVNATKPLILADDFRCEETGFIKDIHFWGSWKDGIEGEILGFQISYHEDIPDPDGDGPLYSRPGTTIYDWYVPFADVVVRPYYDAGDQGWYDPLTGEVELNDHVDYFQYNIFLQEADWLEQDSGNIYWINISAEVVDGTGLWGWKSTLTDLNFNDDAVLACWGNLDWVELYHPGSSGFPYIPGDVNGDGVVNVNDVTYLQNWLMGGGPAPPYFAPCLSYRYYPAGDVDGNGVINFSDLTYLQDYVSGIGPAPIEPPNYPSMTSWGPSLNQAFVITNGETGIELNQKWEQLPDTSNTGFDVSAFNNPQYPPVVLADDFLCTETGPIMQIVVYASWYHDVLPYGDPRNVYFTLSIHSDIPDPDGPGPEFSKPGDLLWIGSPTFQVEPYAVGLEEGWFEPPDYYTPYPDGDTICWKYTFELDSTEFIQQGTPEMPVVYWLDVQAYTEDLGAFFGWKTTLNHWNDDAVWANGIDDFQAQPLPWNELRYVYPHPYEGQSIDLAFEIWGKPGHEPLWDCEQYPPPSKTGGGWETENNDNCTDGDAAQCEYAYCGVIDPTGGDPADWWQFVIPQDTCYCVDVRVFADYTPGTIATGGGLDPELTVYAADCTTQLFYNNDKYGTLPQCEGTDAQYDCNDIGNCHAPGTILNFKVSPAAAGNVGPYLLVINCYQCECPEEPVDTCEYYKAPWEDYAPNGMPDIDQKQYNWTYPASGAWSHCGPVALADCLWWFDSKFETVPVDPRPFAPGPGNPPASDHYSLLASFDPTGLWDDHDTNNVHPFVDSLAVYCNTNTANSGTNVHDMYNGVLNWLAKTGLSSNYTVRLLVVDNEEASYELIHEEILRSQDVILLLGFYQDYTGMCERVGGHYVTCAGVCTDLATPGLCISDPYFDDNEVVSHSPDVHNDVYYVSGPHGTIHHDRYDVIPTTCPMIAPPFFQYELAYYPVTGTNVAAFHGQNLHDPTQAPVDPNPTFSVHTVVEYALIICPVDEEVIDSVVCEPQGGANPPHPPTYWYDVYPNGTVPLCDFHVVTHDSVAANYSAWVEPVGWSHVVHKVGSEWWVSWFDASCTNPLLSYFRFEYANPNPVTWSHWTTTSGGSTDPFTGIVDSSGRHSASTDGYGYRVHAPLPIAAVYDSVVCEPQGASPHPPDYWYDVIPNTPGGLCDFHVVVVDSTIGNYSAWLEPTGWTHSLHKVGTEWWVSWYNTGCTNPITSLFRFGFHNVSPSTFGHWTTTQSGTVNPLSGIADSSGNHTTSIPGYGYTVHVPTPHCCIPPTVGDCDQSGGVDITDISVLIDNQFLTLTPLPCEEEGNINYPGTSYPVTDTVVDITDLTILIDNQFLTLTPLPPCP